MRIKNFTKVIFKTRILIITLVILTVVGWGMVIYFGLKVKTPPPVCDKGLERIHSYAVLLDKSTKLARQEKSFDVLEAEVRSLDNGTLLAEWENVVFGGNQKKDLDNYFDVIIDSLKFFSK